MLGSATDAFISRYGWWSGLRLAWQYRKANALPKGSLVRIDLPELGSPIFVRARTSDVSVLKQALIEGNLEFTVEPTPEYIIDAGANIGVVSLLLAARYPTARIVAVELASSNIELLRMNVRHFENISVLHAALWGRTTQLTVENPGAEPWAFRAHEGVQPDPMAAAIQIPGLTIGDILSHTQMPRVDLLKIDIEGGEREVFSGDTSWVNVVTALAVEIHESIAPGATAAIEAALPAAGFVRSHHGEYVVFNRRETVEATG